MQVISLKPLFLSSVLFVVLVLPSGTGWGDQDLPREQLPRSWKVDAELTDVFFLNPNLGWAVGAQGCIVNTTDGGKRWHEISQIAGMTAGNMPLDQKIRNMHNRVQTRSTGITDGSSAHHPIRCRFESVFFVDEKYGWVAGGYEVPYVGRSRAVVMRTRDGGLTWNAVENLVVPRFHRIHFSDPVNGWAIGKTGNLFPSGVYYTSDGGQSWSSQSSEKTHGWIDAEQTEAGFVTVNEDGRLGVIRANEYERSVVLQDNGAQIAQVRMIDGKTGWAVGENGTLLQTENGGLSWSAVELPGIAKLIVNFDLRTVTASANTIWFAGEPGTFLFSVDRTTGRASAVRTPNNMRINRVHFIDDQTGWAVGAAGAIIATEDGGQTWKVQRGGNQRTAILCVAPNDQSLPLEILSKYGTEENVLCASMILSRTETQNQVAVQATERLGSRTMINIDALGRPTADAESHRRQILRKMVRTLRTMQPNVIVCNAGHSFSSVGNIPAANPVTLIQDAIRMAADSNSFPHQIEDSDLKAWQVDRLAILDPTGTVTIDPHRLLPRTGALIEDQIALSRALIGQSVLADQASIYRVTHFTNRDRMKSGDLLSGLDPRKLVPSRDESGVKRGNLSMIQNANAKHEKFEQFVRFDAKTPQDLLVWRQQIQSFSMKMEQDVAGVWLMQLAERYLATGKTELAANAANLLVTHWSDHAFAPACLSWLAQYYASEEFAQIEFLNRVKNGQITRDGQLSKAHQIRSQFASTPQTIYLDGMSHSVLIPNQAMRETKNEHDFVPDIELASNEQTETPTRPEMFDQRLQLASQFLSQLSQRDPELAAGAQYRLLEAQLSRRLNGILSNEGRYKSLVQQRDFEGAGISLGAQRELGLGGRLPTNSDPLSMFVCQETDQRPRLDGLLTESFWQSAIDSGNVATPTVRLPGREPNPNTDLVMLAYDDEFLYAGFRCQKIDGQYYNTRPKARPRDADLIRRDRVELVFDVDRDYRSVNRFVIDHRGWVRESCTGSLGWDPDWYVSQSEDETSWTVEIAIPLEQLIPGRIEPDSTWAFKVARRGYHPNNLWDDRGIDLTEIVRLQRQGMQIGLESRPVDFELIRFQERQIESQENDEAKKIQ